MPGIFIQAIKRGGLAEEAGLEVGDQIIQVNGTAFHNITHAEVIKNYYSYIKGAGAY